MAARTGTANLPLHGGRVPAWLSSRMAALGRVIAEAIVHEYGRDEAVHRSRLHRGKRTTPKVQELRP